jgi:hypothetical protein
MMMKIMFLGSASAPAVAVAAALASATSAIQAPASRLQADSAHPAVIELYQSQSCSSCPPALKVLQLEADRPEILALNFAVTYWDHLGWKDRFAKPEHTARQWDYAKARGLTQVATPQLIVNGRGHVNGGNRGEVAKALARWDRGRGGPEIGLDGGAVTIGAAAASKPATVWLVSYDPRTLNVPIRAGENGGRTLAHRNIVTGLAPIGSWSGKKVRLVLPAAKPGLKRAVLVQAGKGGPIVAARRI